MTNQDAIKWLENLKQDIGQLRHEDLWHYEQAIDEIAELLKEQEPVKPRYIPPKSIYSWECGVCAEPFDRIANYCPKCGRRVKWE